MTVTAAEPLAVPDTVAMERAERPDSLTRRIFASGRILIAGGVLALMLLLSLATLPWTYFAGPKSPGDSWLVRLLPDAPYTGSYYDRQDPTLSKNPPSFEATWRWFGTDIQGRSVLGRSLLGGTISLAVGAAAAAISVVLGLTVGLVAGYRGGWVDSLLMRLVDIL